MFIGQRVGCVIELSIGWEFNPSDPRPAEGSGGQKCTAGLEIVFKNSDAADWDPK